MRPIVFDKDPSFWYETLRSFGHIAYGGADFGEVVTTAQRITEGDYDSWHDEWLATADRVAGEVGLLDRIGARDAWLRASNYYRSAEFFLHGDPSDPRIDAAYARQVACFRKYAEMTGIEPVEIPYEDTALPGYLYRGTNGATVVMHNGFDGSAEEMHFFGAAALHERGYNVLTFDGPGQPGAMRRGLHFRPDWEQVVTPVLDFLLGLPYVDPEKVALLGASMGGLLAPRAAAFEPRVKALIAFDGVYDMGALVTEHFGGDREAARQALKDPAADGFIREMMAQNPIVRWAVTHGTWATGTTPSGYMLAMLDYHLGDGIAERIACPTLVCCAPDDFSFQGQPEALFEHLTCDKTMIEFSAAEGGDAHCQLGAQRLAMARIAAWLERTFR
ncbi:alpha/beta hydrolase family protein [Nonomuraea sediminis]|uniref:alpha/beta hydrolase family protein n=1 Tax=Nonomuraea sediminis TaxID=2835864 RepID=UPI001BDC3D58|nr:alpha/beta fold hydrolase [Nonomuraea sediminis]